MKYILDTNICIFAIKKNRPALIAKLLSEDPSEFCISSVTYSELVYGVERSLYPERNRLALLLFLSSITILDFDSHAADEAGCIRACLAKRGTPIGFADTLIAGHAKSEGLTLITNNTGEFSRAEGLKVEDWT